MPWLKTKTKLRARVKPKTTMGKAKATKEKEKTKEKARARTRARATNHGLPNRAKKTIGPLGELRGTAANQHKKAKQAKEAQKVADEKEKGSGSSTNCAHTFWNIGSNIWFFAGQRACLFSASKADVQKHVCCTFYGSTCCPSDAWVRTVALCLAFNTI